MQMLGTIQLAYKKAQQGMLACAFVAMFNAALQFLVCCLVFPCAVVVGLCARLNAASMQSTSMYGCQWGIMPGVLIRFLVRVRICNRRQAPPAACLRMLGYVSGVCSAALPC
jgi:hypothetical protein